MRASMWITALFLGLLPLLAEARVNEDGGLCWDPDIEFPVPSGEDEE
jgi:hypothetical protein